MDDDDVVAALVERCRHDHQRWINGDPGGYLLTAERASVMGAFGGIGSGPGAADGQRRAAALFESGTGSLRVVGGGRSGDLAWVSMIEQATVRFRGHDDVARWELRVTEVFERRDGTWQRVHRHADPLVDRHPLEVLLALLPHAVEDSEPG